MVADPFACGRVDVERVEKAAGDHGYCGSDDEERSGISDLGQCHALGNGSDGERDDERKVAHARSDGADVEHALEVDGEIEEDDKVRSGEEELEDAADPDDTLLELLQPMRIVSEWSLIHQFPQRLLP